jgi:hypothetical protein
VTDFDWSNMEKEWCARTCSTRLNTASNATRRIVFPHNFLIIDFPPLANARWARMIFTPAATVKRAIAEVVRQFEI